MDGRTVRLREEVGDLDPPDDHSLLGLADVGEEPLDDGSTVLEVSQLGERKARAHMGGPLVEGSQVATHATNGQEVDRMNGTPFRLEERLGRFAQKPVFHRAGHPFQIRSTQGAHPFEAFRQASQGILERHHLCFLP